MLYGAFRLPGVVEHVGALNTRDGSLRRLADIKRAMLYRVASFAYDPASGTVFYTNDNLAFRDLMAVDVKTGEERMLIEDARIGEIVVQPGRPLADGRPPRERPRDAGAHSATRTTTWYRRPRRFPTNSCPPISTSRPTGDCCRRR